MKRKYTPVDIRVSGIGLNDIFFKPNKTDNCFPFLCVPVDRFRPALSIAVPDWYYHTNGLSP